MLPCRLRNSLAVLQCPGWGKDNEIPCFCADVARLMFLPLCVVLLRHQRYVTTLETSLCDVTFLTRKQDVKCLRLPVCSFLERVLTKAKRRKVRNSVFSCSLLIFRLVVHWKIFVRFFPLFAFINLCIWHLHTHLAFCWRKNRPKIQQNWTKHRKNVFKLLTKCVNFKKICFWNFWGFHLASAHWGTTPVFTDISPTKNS